MFVHRAPACSITLINSQSYIIGFAMAQYAHSTSGKPSLGAELQSNSNLRLPLAVNTLQSVNGARTGHLNLDTFSPVNQNGSFEFDRVLRSGEVYKRTRKTKVF